MSEPSHNATPFREKTKAEQVMELLPKDLGRIKSTDYGFVFVDSWADIVIHDNNPNSAQDIANALLILAGEEVTPKLLEDGNKFGEKFGED